MSETLVVNIWGGPGTGKSTTAALLFGRLKQRGWNAELVHELAKDYVWEERHAVLGFQPYIAAKQMWRIERLRGKVEIVITDGPPLLSLIYLPEEGLPGVRHFADWLHAVNSEWYQFHAFLQRNPDRGYNEAGRYQTQEQAEELDRKIGQFLFRGQIPHQGYQVDLSEDAEHVNRLVVDVEKILNADI